MKAHQPVHVVLRVAPDLGSMRKRKLYDAFRLATFATARREADEDVGMFRIVHLSIQQNHVHLLVEANDKTALALGMQSFQISAAKHINRIVSAGRSTRRRGNVFTDRYHAEIITTPTQARHTLAYVLNNWRKHGEDQTPTTRSWKVDPFSTAVLFPGWVELDESPWLWKWRVTYEPMFVYRPTTWLLREGWRKAGSISCYETPRKKQAAVKPRGSKATR